MQLDSMTLSGVDAIGLGSGDLSLGLDFLATKNSPFVLSNVSCEKQDPWEQVRVKEVGEYHVGFLSFLSSSSSVPDGCTISPPHNSKSIVESTKDVDLWVVSAELSEEESRTLATLFSRVLVIDSKSRRLSTTPKKIGANAALLSAGSRGKHVGLATVKFSSTSTDLQITGLAESINSEKKRYLERIEKAKIGLQDASGKRDRKRFERQIEYYSKKIDSLPSVDFAEGSNPWTLSNTVHGLDKSVASHQETEVLIQAYKSAEESLEVEMEESLYNGPFIGSKSCQGCHPYQFSHWQETKHAKAWQTLVDEKRSKDQECYSCHVTGAHHQQGPKSLSESKGLENVGCETCHGPGEKHVQSSGQVDMIKEPSVQSCTRCHDGIKDEGRFDAAIYYPKVRHPSFQSEDEQ